MRGIKNFFHGAMEILRKFTNKCDIITNNCNTIFFSPRVYFGIG